MPQFAQELVRWQKTHGRNSLPWQNTRDPYRVWLSEIMLQQTQVSTVLDYYARFLVRFPLVTDLAAAHIDEVLGLWSGLGYYSRARNLHGCAQQVVALHGGQFPATAEGLQTLPGIGPSTAAAIASFCFSERVAILDGNVKRVLTRLLAFEGDLAQGSQEKRLREIANELLPRENLKEAMPRYTQGIMDLGATVCTSRKPACLLCPAHGICLGFAGGEPEKYPVKTRKLKRSAQSLSLLWAQRPDGSVWLERRPATGIWGGLYCLPVFESEEALLSFLPKKLHARMELLPPLKHVLTHKDLLLSPVIAGFSATQKMPARQSPDETVSETESHGAWFSPSEWSALGLPAPVRKLLETDR
ncbi:MAG: A/G-specific adenine glycosylase [Pseudomonadota bacterium]